MAAAFNPPDRERRSLVRSRLHDNDNNDHYYCYYHCYDEDNDDVDDSTMAAQRGDVGINLDGGGTRSTMMREPMMRMSRQGQAGGGTLFASMG
jgi:hypothetical protein